jgi:hypothetical protein
MEDVRSYRVPVGTWRQLRPRCTRGKLSTSFGTWYRMCIKFDTSGLCPEVLRSLVSSLYQLLFLLCLSLILGHKFTTCLMVLHSDYQRSSSAAQNSP